MNHNVLFYQSMKLRNGILSQDGVLCITKDNELYCFDKSPPIFPDMDPPLHDRSSVMDCDC